MAESADPAGSGNHPRFHAEGKRSAELADVRLFYYITRYPVGLDATVSKSSGGGVQDLTWTNDTAYPVLIKSFKTGGSVTFSLYGIPSGRTVSFSKPIIKNYKSATNETVLVSTLPTGKAVRIEYPDDGFDAWVTRTVRDASILLAALAGADADDPATAASSGHVPVDYTRYLDTQSLQGARIGVARNYFGFHDGVDAVMRDAGRIN